MHKTKMGLEERRLLTLRNNSLSIMQVLDEVHFTGISSLQMGYFGAMGDYCIRQRDRLGNLMSTAPFSHFQAVPPFMLSRTFSQAPMLHRSLAVDHFTRLGRRGSGHSLIK